MDTRYLRFSGLSWATEVQEKEITIIGLGGIGSNVALPLARLNPKKIFLIDPDVVEEVNLAGQAFFNNHVGMKKVDAVAEVLYSWAGYKKIAAIPTLLTEGTDFGEITITGFDNMNARKIAFTNFMDSPAAKLLVDARMSVDTIQIFTLLKEDTEFLDIYRDKWLFSDAMAQTAPCSMKQTSYTGSILGGLVVNIIINYISSSFKAFPKQIMYNTNNMLYETV